MSDKFGRHQSTRWVRASVPSYGDEWNDAYDYGSVSDSGSEKNHSPDLNVVAEKFDGSERANESLVLSIDNLKRQESDDENDEEGNEENDEVDGNDSKSRDSFNMKSHDSFNLKSHDSFNLKSHDSQDSYSHSHSGSGNIKTQVISAPSNSLFHPPRSANTETPLSETSFASDADSIQNEPANINVVGNTHNPKSALLGYNSIIEEYPSEGENVKESEAVSAEVNDTNKGVNEGVNDNINESVNDNINESVNDNINKNPNDNTTKDQSNPLVLSIDKKEFQNQSSDSESVQSKSKKFVSDSDSDDDDDDDPVPYYEKQMYNEDDASEFGDYNNDQGNHSRKLDALDSLIHDLQSASFSNDNKDLLPNVDSGRDVSLPDFDYYNYGDYDDDFVDDTQDQPVTPIAPLSTTEEKNYHEKYVNELSGRPSIRKPPTSLGPSGDKEKESIPQILTDEKQSSTLPQPNIPPPSASSSNYDTIDSALSEKKFDFSQSGTPQNEKPPIDTKTTESSSIQEEPSLNRVASTGSISTGKHSLDVNSQRDLPEPPTVDRDLGRRDSTMSTNTFSMGGWKPNTNNFRDQFINDNDNESSFNFDASDSNSGYQKFTKLRHTSTASDTMSFASSVSIPETVDVPLPSIHEDPDDGGNANDDTFTSDNDGPSSGLGISNHNFTSDSVLQDHKHENHFQEEPQYSLSSVHKRSGSIQSQRYSSLLPQVPTDDNKLSVAGSRDVSGATKNTVISDSSNKTTDTSKTTDTGNTKDSSESDTQSAGPSSSIQSSYKDAPSTTMSSKRLASGESVDSQGTKRTFVPSAYPVSNWNTIMKPSQPVDRIRLLKEALEKEIQYNTGLQNWLDETLGKSNNASNIHIGRIASQAYQNAPHNDLRRHQSIRSRVSSVRDKVETSGLQASTFGKKFLNRGKKLMKPTT